MLSLTGRPQKFALNWPDKTPSRRPILNDLYRTNGLVRGREKSSGKRAF